MNTPVPHTGRNHYHRHHPKNGGLSGRLPGRYADEGDKGPTYRRAIRHREGADLRREIRNGGHDA